jgi:hypothetical protein
MVLRLSNCTRDAYRGAWHAAARPRPGPFAAAPGLYYDARLQRPASTFFGPIMTVSLHGIARIGISRGNRFWTLLRLSLRTPILFRDADVNGAFPGGVAAADDRMKLRP